MILDDTDKGELLCPPLCYKTLVKTYIIHMFEVSKGLLISVSIREERKTVNNVNFLQKDIILLQLNNDSLAFIPVALMVKGNYPVYRGKNFKQIKKLKK